MTALHHEPVAVADRSDLAALFIRWLETHEIPAGLFTDDVFCDLSLPQWRLQGVGPETVHQLRVGPPDHGLGGPTPDPPDVVRLRPRVRGGVGRSRALVLPRAHASRRA